MGQKARTKRCISKQSKMAVVKRNLDGESSEKLSKELISRVYNFTEIV